MADITVTVNSTAIRTLLDRAPQSLDTAIRGAMNDSATYFLALMKRYPTQRAGSQYIRTNTLMRSWSMRPITRTAEGWRIITGSNGLIAPYNRYVVDRERQAAMHRGRWQTAQTVAEQSVSQVQRFVDGRVRMALGGL